MNLKVLSIQELDQRIKTLVQNERDLLREVLLTIKEIDTRKMYLDLGFSSLFAYLVNIGYQGGSAQRRIDAVRLMKEIPDLSQKIQTGDTSLNQVSLLQKAIRQSSKKITSTQKESLLADISKQTRRESEKTLAHFFEIPVVDAEFQKTQANDSVRVEITINKELYEQIQEAQEYLSHSLPNKEIKSYLEYLTSKVLKQKHKKVNMHFLVAEKNARNEAQTKNNTEIKNQVQAKAKGKANTETKSQFRIKAMTKIKSQFQDKATVKIPSQKDVKAAARTEIQNKSESAAKIENHAKNKISVSVETNKQQNLYANHFRAEVALPQRVRRQMLQAYKECQYQDPKTGQKCQTRWHLQVDHKQPRWAGGLNIIDNLQVLCAGHNQLKYRSEHGHKFL